MEDHTKTDQTLDLWRELRPLNPESGVVIQAALHRSHGRHRGDDRGGRARSPLQGRLQRAAVGRPARARRDQRRLRGAGPATDGRRRLPGPRHARRAAHRAAGPLGRGRGDRPRPVRVPDALRRPPRPPGAAAGARLPGPGLRAVRLAVVPVLHAPPGREAGERDVHAPIAREGGAGGRRRAATAAAGRRPAGRPKPAPAPALRTRWRSTQHGARRRPGRAGSLRSTASGRASPRPACRSLAPDQPERATRAVRPARC